MVLQNCQKKVEEKNRVLSCKGCSRPTKISPSETNVHCIINGIDCVGEWAITIQIVHASPYVLILKNLRCKN